MEDRARPPEHLAISQGVQVSVGKWHARYHHRGAPSISGAGRRRRSLHLGYHGNHQCTFQEDEIKGHGRPACCREAQNWPRGEARRLRPHSGCNGAR
ncbi:hypothetical protein ATCV1_z602R [Acanthocystis turfacea chlorella virus 1]|uniref:Uncharacterized protein z602R n=1 Tax=Chlorovirus heliozoae TaxID=322019 RepID=A7K9L2_9PHYC|nr:hypothetical protein ATCV1_z602R [Acanthocystis turfacea chlorella virus 1]ABT16736.1 hypothetical protein ATCV1_z602R [Acanthocystis turfacea chlorella virus 1]